MDNELDGNVSEMDLTDDDDEDADPNYEPDVSHEVTDLDGEVIQEIEEEEEEPAVPGRNSDATSTTNVERVFWRKKDDFWPLPPAPDHEEQPLNALNLPPKDYVSKYIPDNIHYLNGIH